MDGYNFDTLADFGPVQLPRAPRIDLSGSLPAWRGASQGMWGLLFLLVVGLSSFAAIVLSTSASLKLAGI